MNKIVFLMVVMWSSTVLSQECLDVVTTDSPPYQMLEDGKVVGMSTEIVAAILDEAGFKGEFHLYPWARAYHFTQQDHPVLIYNIGRTSEREHLFHWIGTVAPNNVYLWKLKKRREIVLETIDDVNTYHVGVMKDDLERSYLLERGVHESHLDIASRDELNFKKLLHGRIDLMPYDELAFLYRIKEYGYSADLFEKSLWLEEISNNAFLAASGSTPKPIAKRLQEAWNIIQRNGRYESIVRKYTTSLRH